MPSLWPAPIIKKNYICLWGRQRRSQSLVFSRVAENKFRNYIPENKKVKEKIKNKLYYFVKDEIIRYTPISSKFLGNKKVKLQSELTNKPELYDCIVYGVTGPDYDIIKLHTDDWATKTNGSVKLRDDPEFFGVLGEMAFATATGLQVKIGSAKGKRCSLQSDFDFGTHSIDVKARPVEVGTKGYANLLIFESTGLACDYYVGSIVFTSKQHPGKAIVCLCGYIFKNDIPRKLHKARQGDHYNYEVPFENLSPIQELIDRIKNVK